MGWGCLSTQVEPLVACVLLPLSSPLPVRTTSRTSAASQLSTSDPACRDGQSWTGQSLGALSPSAPHFHPARHSPYPGTPPFPPGASQLCRCSARARHLGLSFPRGSARAGGPGSLRLESHLAALGCAQNEGPAGLPVPCPPKLTPLRMASLSLPLRDAINSTARGCLCLPCVNLGSRRGRRAKVGRTPLRRPRGVWWEPSRDIQAWVWEAAPPNLEVLVVQAPTPHGHSCPAYPSSHHLCGRGTSLLCLPCECPHSWGSPSIPELQWEAGHQARAWECVPGHLDPRWSGWECCSCWV